jgi:hypothetical protein
MGNSTTGERHDMARVCRVVNLFEPLAGDAASQLFARGEGDELEFAHGKVGDSADGKLSLLYHERFVPNMAVLREQIVGGNWAPGAGGIKFTIGE